MKIGYFMKKFFIFICLIPFLLLSDVKKEKAYTPWYTGPLISTGADNITLDDLYIQPYLYYQNLYTKPFSTFNFTAQIEFEAPITNYFDFTLYLTGMYNEVKNQQSLLFADTAAAFGIQLLRQEEFTYKPSIRLKINQNFPTGKYSDLNPEKLGADISGSGYYTTSISLVFGKTQYWFFYHPIAWIVNTSVLLPSTTKVKNFHRYGGGFKTQGKIKEGYGFAEDVAVQYSFNQRWVFTIDFIYFYLSKGIFKGNPGFDLLGNVANNGSDELQQITLAPGLEYNFNINFGVLGGVVFSVWQKNIPKIVSGIISVAFTF